METLITYEKLAQSTGNSLLGAPLTRAEVTERCEPAARQ